MIVFHIFVVPLGVMQGYWGVKGSLGVKGVPEVKAVPGAKGSQG